MRCGWHGQEEGPPACAEGCCDQLDPSAGFYRPLVRLPPPRAQPLPASRAAPSIAPVPRHATAERSIATPGCCGSTGLGWTDPIGLGSTTGEIRAGCTLTPGSGAGCTCMHTCAPSAGRAGSTAGTAGSSAWWPGERARLLSDSLPPESCGPLARTGGCPAAMLRPRALERPPVLRGRATARPHQPGDHVSERHSHLRATPAPAGAGWGANWFPAPVQQPAIGGDTSWVALVGAARHPGSLHAPGPVHPSGTEHVQGSCIPPGVLHPTPVGAFPQVGASPAQLGARPGSCLPLCRQREVAAARGSCGAGDLQCLVCVISFFFFLVLYLHRVFQPKPPRCRINPLRIPRGASLPAPRLGGTNKNLPNTIKQRTTIQHILRASLREAGRQMQPVKAHKIVCRSAATVLKAALMPLHGVTSTRGPTLGKRRGGLPPALQVPRSKLGMPGDPRVLAGAIPHTSVPRMARSCRDNLKGFHGIQLIHGHQAITCTRLGRFPADQPGLREPSGAISRALMAAQHQAQPPGDRDGPALGHPPGEPALPAPGWTGATSTLHRGRGEAPPAPALGRAASALPQPPGSPGGTKGCWHAPERWRHSGTCRGRSPQQPPRRARRCRRDAIRQWVCHHGVVMAVARSDAGAQARRCHSTASRHLRPLPVHGPPQLPPLPAPPTRPPWAPAPAGTTHRPLAWGPCLSPGTALRGQGCPCLCLLPRMGARQWEPVAAEPPDLCIPPTGCCDIAALPSTPNCRTSQTTLTAPAPLTSHTPGPSTQR